MKVLDSLLVLALFIFALPSAIEFGVTLSTFSLLLLPLPGMAVVVAAVYFAQRPFNE